jgi:hypothetical protein
VTNRVALPARATAITAGPVGAVVATRDGTVTWIARPDPNRSSSPTPVPP